MQKQATTPYCVYTIVDGKKLALYRLKAYQDVQHRLWVTAHSLFEKGRLENQRMPVLLGDANNCEILLYWGFLENIILDRESKTTAFTVDKLHPIKQGHSPQDLTLRSSGKNIAAGFIRPYAICQKPKFLDI